MKRAAVAFLTLALAGCEHMYGGIDHGRVVSTAVRYAEAKNFRIDDPSRALVADGGKTWDVSLNAPCETCVGGPIIVSVSKVTRRPVGLVVLQ